MGIRHAFRAFFKALRNSEPERVLLEDTSNPDPSHLRLLAMLQKSGRLIDFLKEDISRFTDAQVGAAARRMHTDCGQIIEDLVTVRPVFEEAEGSSISVPEGYDSSQVKIVGRVGGDAPFSGKLVHKGWKVHKQSLPKQLGQVDLSVLCPAEVEVK